MLTFFPGAELISATLTNAKKSRGDDESSITGDIGFLRGILMEIQAMSCWTIEEHQNPMDRHDANGNLHHIDQLLFDRQNI
jgi:hypothetical protein